MTEYYLKPTVIAEPLIWRWYAWPYLISPATAACNIVDRHLKIMQSYVQNPILHAHAVKDPKMLGGPFVDLDVERVEEISKMINCTRQDCADLIELNNSLKYIDKLLQDKAKGSSLDEFYKELPLNLRGLGEFVYDLNSHPSIRLIEPLIYNTYYNTNFQEIAISNITSDFRKFVLSTPRLDQDNEIYLQIPFSDKRVDSLIQLKETPSNLESIITTLNIKEKDIKLFKSFFTTEKPIKKIDSNYSGDGVRVRYFGHACILVETNLVSVLFDPVISYPLKNNIDRYTYFDLPDIIDYVVITHNHQDHLMLEALIHLRHKVKNIVFPSNQKGALQDPSIKLILQNTGFESLIEISEMEKLQIKEGEIIALPFLGEHSDLNIQSKMSYCINIKGKKILLAADSNNLDEFLYERLFNEIGSINMLFLGMECNGAPLSWLYGPLLTFPLSREFDRSRTLSGSNFDKAKLIVEKLRCQEAYIYAMGQEPWLHYVMALSYSPDSPQIVESNKFIQYCKKNDIKTERLFGSKEWQL